MAYVWDGYMGEGEDFDANEYAAECTDGDMDADGDHQFQSYQILYPFPNTERWWLIPKPSNPKPPVVPGKRRKIKKPKPIQVTGP